MSNKRTTIKFDTRKYKSLFSANIMGIMEATLCGQITYGNSTFLEMIGYSKEELKADKLHWDLLTPEKWKNADQKAMEELKNTGVATPWEKEFVHKNGQKIPVILGVASLEEHQEKCICFVVDISRQKQAEKQIKQYNKMLEKEISKRTWELELAKQIKDEFLARMSHELRTPLNPIIGLSEMMQQQLIGTLNETQKEYIDIIHKSAQQLLSIVDDILLVTESKNTSERSLFSLNQIISQSLQEIETLATSKNIIVDYDVGIIRRINADHNKIAQVLKILLSNAIHFTPYGGTVSVDLADLDIYKVPENISKKLSSQKSYVKISIKDTGVGIPKEEQQKIFEKFYQVSDSRKYNAGVGLGLTLAKNYIEEHSGSIWVESNISQKGSCFYVVLPME